MGTSSRGASLQTSNEAIDFFSPKMILMPGIAFGKDSKKQSIGDILIAERLIPYESQRVNPDGKNTYRSAHPQSNLTLVNRFQNFKEHSFQFNENKIDVSVNTCSVLSGEKLVDNEIYKKDLFDNFPTAKGGEMEGLGVYVSAESKNKPWILIKSICDWADGYKDSVTKGDDQKIAATSVLSFCYKVLNTKHIFENLSIYEYTEDRKEVQEIALEVSDIVHLEVSPRYRDTLDTLIPKEKDRHTRYVYYSLKKKGRTEGYLFLGRDIRINKLLDHFKNITKLPNSLIVCMPKNALYKLKSLKEAISKILGNNIIEEVLYLDDFIKSTTALTQNSFTGLNSIENYIDQELFSVAFVHEIESKLHEIGIGPGIEYFKNSLETNLLPTVSLLLGTAGVGKSTFCDKLEEQLLSSSDKYILKISGEIILDNIEEGDNFQVESLIDLFDFYKKLNVDTAFNLDPVHFELNYVSGNIIVLIDGLDEISSVMAERFHFKSFFHSLNELDQRFHSSNIIITTRDENIEKYIDYKNLDLFRLKGFKEVDVAKFVETRFNKERIKMQKVNSILSEISLESEKLIPPLFVELICDGIERENIDNDDIDEDIDEELKNSYLDVKKVFDRIILILLYRDIEKQSLNMTLDEMIELIFEIMIINSNSLKIDEFDLLLSQYTPDTVGSTDKYKRNPLFIFNQKEKTIKIKYEAVVALFRARYLQFALEQNDYKEMYKIENILRECYQGNSYIFDEIVSNINMKKITNFTVFSDFISKFVSKLVDTKTIHQDYYKRSISGLLYIAFKTNTELKSSKERTEFLLKLYKSKSSVENLYIYGKFYALDFQNIFILDSEFNAFTSLKDSTFPEQINKPIFHSSYFRRIGLPQNKKINPALFEGCSIDESIKHAILNFQEKANIESSNLKKDFKAITAKNGANRTPMRLLFGHQ